ncbi:MAG: VUT family protein [Chloroflexi bacterium]|nr:MAG: VUT family protein [Chloroflexota bacterium]
MRRPPQHLAWLVALAAAYTVIVAVSNLLVDKFIDLGAFGMLSAGTLTFGATFTLRDLAHQSSDRAGLGRTPVLAMIGVAAIANVAVAAIIGIPGRFLVASFGAILLSEGVDTEIYHALRSRSWLVRVLSSNAVSVPLDSITFTVVAFAGEVGYGVSTMAQIIEADLLFKFGIGALIALGKTAWNRARDRRSLNA